MAVLRSLPTAIRSATVSIVAARGVGGVVHDGHDVVGRDAFVPGAVQVDLHRRVPHDRRPHRDDAAVTGPEPAHDVHHRDVGTHPARLQSIANIVVVAVILLAVAALAGECTRRWVADRPDRVATVSAAGLVVAGVFSILYWDVRLLSVLDVIPWYPVAPWV